jgi:DNA-3-methyladenine glycosylase II
MAMKNKKFSKAIRHLRKSDPILASMIRKVGDCTLIPREGHYGSLLRSIISQQISTSAARTIHDRFLAKAGSFHPERILKMKDDELRAIGLSPQKMSYIKDLSLKVHQKEVDLEGASISLMTRR